MRKLLAALMLMFLIFTSSAMAWGTMPGQTLDSPTVVKLNDWQVLIAVEGGDQGIWFCIVDYFPSWGSPSGRWSMWNRLSIGKVSSSPSIVWMGISHNYYLFNLVMQGVDNNIYSTFLWVREDDSPDAKDMNVFHIKMVPITD
jgi:hypothetical protein